MSYQEAELVNQADLAKSRAQLGSAFLRIHSYFPEDDDKAIGAIAQAVRERNAIALVTPAHTLKGESAQFGAHRLSSMAERIEMVARRCVETREGPDELIEVVVSLRPCFTETMSLLDHDSNPLVARRPATFGRRSEPPSQGFGRVG